MTQFAQLLRWGVERLAEMPWAFDSLRWMLEGGYRRHRELLTHHFPRSPRRVLDCGCGTGIYAGCFPAQAYVGIDISPAYIARARSRHPGHRFEVMDATQLAFADGSFDAVVVCGVVHHLDEEIAGRMLAEIARVLQPGGRLLLWEDVPTRGGLNLVGHWVHQLDVGEHIRPEHEYVRLLQPHFEVESIEGLRSGFMDYTAFVARKAEAKAGALPRSSNVPATCAPDGSLPVSDWLLEPPPRWPVRS